MLYPYICDSCGPFEVVKPMSEASRPEPCPECAVVSGWQDYAAKNINGGVTSDGNWVRRKDRHPASLHAPRLPCDV